MSILRRLTEALWLDTSADHPVPPGTINEMIQLAYVPDVVQRVVKHMTEFDPTFKLPVDFFPAKTQVNGNASHASEV